MPDYIYLISPLRAGFYQYPTPQEEVVMEAHFEYLRQATSQGKVLLAGPCLDETFGIVVLRAGSEAEARAFMSNDPSVKDEVMKAELHPMKVSLMRE